MEGNPTSSRRSTEVFVYNPGMLETALPYRGEITFLFYNIPGT